MWEPQHFQLPHLILTPEVSKLLLTANFCRYARAANRGSLRAMSCLHAHFQHFSWDKSHGMELEAVAYFFATWLY